MGMRLTEKLIDKNGNYYNLLESDLVNGYQSVDKLGQLEDIEEELGISLIILFKALKDGIYDINGHHYLDITLDLEDGCLSRMHDDGNDIEFHDFWFKDYGKEWALTKEELK